MAINIYNNRITSTAQAASIDQDYGPYVGSTLEVALALAENSLALKKALGKTVGIQVGDVITEYWYQYDSQDTLVLVEKLQSVAVEANPTEDATVDLEKIKIGETIYEIPDPDTSNLATKQELQQGLLGKQDTINDLQTIRSDANAGATAIQGVRVNGTELPTDENKKVNIRFQDIVGGLAYGDIVGASASLTPDTSCYYITNGEGTYSAFGNVQVYSNDHVQILTYDGTQWQVTDLPWYKYSYLEPKIELLEPFEGATASEAGVMGLVPAPTVNDRDKILQGDGNWVQKPANGQDGASAYDIWLEESGHQSTDPGYSEQDFLNSLKAQFGSFIPAEYGTDGKPASGGVVITPNDTTTNYIYLVDNNSDPSSVTAKVMWVTVVDNTNPQSPTYSWQNIGEVHVSLLFASGQDVTDVYIVDNLDSNSPTDILAARQGKELNLSINGETTLVGDNTNRPPSSGKYVNSNGELLSGSGYLLTNPIYLHVGQFIDIERTHNPAYGSVFKTDSELTTVTRVAGLGDLTYEVAEDGYYSVQVNPAGTWSINIITKGLKQSIGELSELETADKSTIVNAINEVNQKDSIPTENSDKPISSSGVYEALNGENGVYSTIEENKSEFEQGLGNPVMDDSNMFKGFAALNHNAGGITIRQNPDNSIYINSNGSIVSVSTSSTYLKLPITFEANEDYILVLSVIAGKITYQNNFRMLSSAFTINLYPRELKETEDTTIETNVSFRFSGAVAAKDAVIYPYLVKKSVFNELYCGKRFISDNFQLGLYNYKQATVDEEGNIIECVKSDWNKEVNVPVKLNKRLVVKDIVNAKDIEIADNLVSSIWDKDLNVVESAFSTQLDEARSASEEVVQCNNELSNPFVIDINSQEDFENIMDSIKEATADGEKNIIVNLKADTLYFNERHFNFTNAEFTDNGTPIAEDVNIMILGSENCEVISKGTSYARSSSNFIGDKCKHLYQNIIEKFPSAGVFGDNVEIPISRHTFLTDDGKYISCYGRMKYALSQCEFVSGPSQSGTNISNVYRLLLQPEDRNLNIGYIQLTCAYEAFLFKITDHVDNDGYVTIRTSNIIGRNSLGGINVNGDYKQYDVYPRYRLVLSDSDIEFESVDNVNSILISTKYDRVYECLNQTFLYVNDDRSATIHPFKSISLIGINFNGNVDKGFNFYDSEMYNTGLIHIQEFEQDYIQISGCHFENLKSTAIVATAPKTNAPDFTVQNIVVKGNTMANCDMGLMSASPMTSHIYVMDNKLDSVYKDLHYGGAIAIGGQHFLIARNFIRDFTYAGIKSGHEWAPNKMAEPYAGSQGIIEDNILCWSDGFALHAWEHSLYDGGYLYIYCRTKGIIVRRNVLYGMSSIGKFKGIQLDGMANKVTVIDNAILCSCNWLSFGNGVLYGGSPPIEYEGNDVFINNLISAPYYVQDSSCIKGRNIALINDNTNKPSGNSLLNNVVSEDDLIVKNSSIDGMSVSVPNSYYATLRDILVPQILSLVKFNKYQ